ncbi:unnamed protein product [Lupinus luteus]|uniref:Uncharacterized protein n=1 Tax=Lupinus luteus TaxID=3873 RepID=A0AAV1XAM6_LUPLU
MGKSLSITSFFVLLLVLASGLNIESEDQQVNSGVDNKPCKSDQECGTCPPFDPGNFKPCCLCLRGKCQCTTGPPGIHKLNSIE